jgi:glyceraldehyde 3-phosphate dehydrogenase
MIPASTGATESIGKIFPDLCEKLSGLSVRVPTPNVSLLDFTFTAARKTSVEEINDFIVRNADGVLAGVLGYSTEPLVSVDFNHSSLSSSVDLSLTRVIDGKVVHLVAWYDNEWAFSNRMLDTAAAMFQSETGRR